MRIAFLGDSLDKQSGGIHIYTKELLHALSQVDKKNEYIVVRAERKGEFENMEELVVPYRNFSGYRAWRLFVELPRLLSKKGVDIVVEPGHFGPFNLPKRIKRVTVIHDLTMFLFPNDHVFFSQFLQRKFLPHILRNTNHIITNSENTTTDLYRFFPFTKNKTTATLLGKSLSFKPKNDYSVLKKYGIKMPYLLFLGTLEPRKNVVTLIQAFNDFKAKSGLPYQLILVGKKGWKSTPIFQEIENSPFKNDIFIPGYVEREDLPVIYSMTEIFVYPSKYEGFGLPILEAMACGTPVITSNISSLPEVGGSAAEYVSPNSVSELSQKINFLSQNPQLRAEMSQKSLTQAAHFSWGKTAKQTIKVFEKLK